MQIQSFSSWMHLGLVRFDLRTLLIHSIYYTVVQYSRYIQKENAVSRDIKREHLCVSVWVIHTIMVPCGGWNVTLQSKSSSLVIDCHDGRWWWQWILVAEKKMWPVVIGKIVIKHQHMNFLNNTILTTAVSWLELSQFVIPDL